VLHAVDPQLPTTRTGDAERPVVRLVDDLRRIAGGVEAEGKIIEVAREA